MPEALGCTGWARLGAVFLSAAGATVPSVFMLHSRDDPRPSASGAGEGELFPPGRPVYPPEWVVAVRYTERISWWPASCRLLRAAGQLELLRLLRMAGACCCSSPVVPAWLERTRPSFPNPSLGSCLDYKQKTKALGIVLGGRASNQLCLRCPVVRDKRDRREGRVKETERSREGPRWGPCSCAVGPAVDRWRQELAQEPGEPGLVPWCGQQQAAQQNRTSSAERPAHTKCGAQCSISPPAVQPSVVVVGFVCQLFGQGWCRDREFGGGPRVPACRGLTAYSNVGRKRLARDPCCGGSREPRGEHHEAMSPSSSSASATLPCSLPPADFRGKDRR